MNLTKFVFVSLLGAFVVMGHMALSLSAFAQSRDLATVMKQMGSVFGPVSRPISQGVAGEKEAHAVHQLLGLIEEAALINPAIVDEAPLSEREGLLNRYHELMDQLHVATEELESSLIAKDVPRYQAAFKKVGALRSVGHQEFKI